MPMMVTAWICLGLAAAEKTEPKGQRDWSSAAVMPLGIVNLFWQSSLVSHHILVCTWSHFGSQGRPGGQKVM